MFKVPLFDSVFCSNSGSLCFFQEKNSSPSTPRSPGPGLNLLKSPSPHKTLPGELSSGVSDRHIKSSSSGGPGLAVAPSRCLSPGVRSSRQESKHGRSGPGRGAKQVQNGSSRAAPSRSLRQEVEPDDASLHQVRFCTSSTQENVCNDVHQLLFLNIYLPPLSSRGCCKCVCDVLVHELSELYKV